MARILARLRVQTNSHVQFPNTSTEPRGVGYKSLLRFGRAIKV